MSDVLPEDRSFEPITVDSLVEDLRSLGIEAGQTLLVHGSLSALGWVCGGAPTVVDALQEAIREEGTVLGESESDVRSQARSVPLQLPTAENHRPYAGHHSLCSHTF